MRLSQMVSGVVMAACLISGAYSGSTLADGPDEATNPTSRQPESANTPTQASRNVDDDHVTQQIRAALMADTSLSNEARRVDVRTNADAVTLRGAVSADEKDKIEHVVSQFAGSRQVASQLTVHDAPHDY